MFEDLTDTADGLLVLIDFGFDDLPEEIRILLEDIDPDKIIIGTSGDDVIVGSSSADGILADPTVRDDVGGNDRVSGDDGDDVILTFGGADEVLAGRGNDLVRTADDPDFVRGNRGDDDIQSGRGDDEVYGGQGDDVLRGGEDDDVLDGGSGNDRVVGGSDDDILIDGSGKDQLEGRAGSDRIVLDTDGTKDRVVFEADDLGRGTDTISGFDARDPKKGGDLVDLRLLDIDEVQLDESGADVTIGVRASGEAETTQLALIEDAGSADRLMDNIKVPDGVVVQFSGEAPTKPVLPVSDGLFEPYRPEIVAETAALALAAYREGGAALQTRLASLAPAWTALGARELGLDAGLFTSEGYYEKDEAAGFVARDGSRLAIVYRGSDSVSDLIATALAQDEYFDDLKPLIRAALLHADREGIADILLTGHSLGGAMVQRTAASIDDFEAPDGASWHMTAFGPPGTDIDDKTAFSRTVLNIEHTGDPVPDDPVLSTLTQHGFFATIRLPNVEGADDLVELARQKQAQDDDSSIITEHDMLRYLLTVEAIETSPLYSYTDVGQQVVVLDRPDGSSRDDDFRIDEGGLALGLDGGDTLKGGTSKDLVDGGAGNDILTGKTGKDRLFGGAGDDVLNGGSGRDLYLFQPGGGKDEVKLVADEDVLDLRAYGLDFAALDSDGDGTLSERDDFVSGQNQELTIDIGAAAGFDSDLDTLVLSVNGTISAANFA